MTCNPLIPMAVDQNHNETRIVYRNQVDGVWTMVVRNTGGWYPYDEPERPIVTRTYSSGVNAMRGLMIGPDLLMGDTWQVDDADTALGSHTVELFHLPAAVDADGTLADVDAVLEYVKVQPGVQMYAERAAAEIEAAEAVLVCSDFADAPRDGDPSSFRSVPTATGSYRPRPLFGMSDVDFLRELRTVHGHARLSGPPGAGKTTAVLAAFGDDVVSVQGHRGLTVAALCGQYLPHDGGWRWSDGPLTRAMREGKVLLFDELNRAPADVDDVLLSALDQRRELILADRPDLPAITARDGFMVVATYNEGDAKLRPLTPALLRRLNIHVRVDSDYGIVRDMGVRADLLRVAYKLRSSAHDFGNRHRSEPAWHPQTADLLGAQSMVRFGPQATFTALTASCADRTRLDEAAAVFSSVVGFPVRSVAVLGEDQTPVCVVPDRRVRLTIDEHGGDRWISWVRDDRDDLSAEGWWSGDPGWIEAAKNALLTRSDVLVAQPGLYYRFSPFADDRTVEEMAAAMIAAAGPRGDCTEAIAELPAELFDDDAPADAIY